jgi:YD repeat-containing protein
MPEIQGQKICTLIHIRTYTYDAGRRLKTRTDQANLITTYVYDSANRLATRDYPGSVDDLFTYDLVSRLKTGTSQRFGTVVARAYDAAGRLTTNRL